jgi:5-methylcytosine-specific restriction endonuclease McrA
LDRAYGFRNKYFQFGDLGFNGAQYNAKKIRGYCEICKTELAEEIHHLSPQRLADENGFIKGFHKNHIANLASVCESCHNKIHSEQHGKMERRKTTKGYKIV